MGGAGYAHATWQGCAGNHRPKMLDAIRKFYRQHRASQRIQQHVARGVVRLLRVDLVIDEVIGDVDHGLVGIRSDGGTDVVMAHAGSSRWEPGYSCSITLHVARPAHQSPSGTA